MYPMISLIIGLIIILLIGLFLTIRLKINRTERLLFSFGIGTLIIFSIFFILNQYFKIAINSFNIRIVTIILLVLSLIYALFSIKFREFKKIMLETFKVKFELDLFLILMIFLYFIVFYKSIFLPITTGDATTMYAFSSKYTWQNGFLPIPSSALMEISYAFPNTNFIIILANYFFGINGSFDELLFKILIPIFSILNLFLVYYISNNLFKNKIVSRLSIALLLSTVAFSALLIQEYTAMFEIFFPLLAIYSFTLYDKNKDNKYFYLTAIFLGATLMSKYTIIPWVIAFLVFYLVYYKNFKGFVKLTLISFLISFIFYLRNLIFYKNPFYPLFFKGINYNDSLASITLKWNIAPEYSIPQLFNIIVPITLFIILYFILYLIIYKKDYTNSNVKKTIVSILLFHLLFWFLTSAFVTQAQGYRHLILTLSLMSIFSSSLVIFSVRKNKQYFVYIPLILTVLFNIVYQIFYSKKVYYPHSIELIFVSTLVPLLIFLFIIFSKKMLRTASISIIIILFLITPFAFSAFAKRSNLLEFPNKEEIIERYVEHYPVLKYINSNTSKDSRILSYNGVRYYLDREMVMADNPSVNFIYKDITLDEAIKKLKEMKINYIMYTKNEETIPIINYSIVHKNLNSNKFVLIYKNNEDYLYKLK